MAPKWAWLRTAAGVIALILRNSNTDGVRITLTNLRLHTRPETFSSRITAIGTECYGTVIISGIGIWSVRRAGCAEPVRGSSGLGKAHPRTATGAAAGARAGVRARSPRDGSHTTHALPVEVTRLYVRSGSECCVGCLQYW